LSLSHRPLWTNQPKIVDRWLLTPEGEYVVQYFTIGEISPHKR
jgi:hypothetical protein